jgi:hypothetical protein
MMEKIRSVEIVFKNCDICRLPVESNSDLIEFKITGITKSVSSCNLNKEIIILNVADEVKIEFSKEALEFPTFWEKEYAGNGNLLKNQLKFRDICAIKIYYGDVEIKTINRGNDPKNKEYYILYEAENESELGSPNINQINTFLDNGNCIVEIKRR